MMAAAGHEKQRALGLMLWFRKMPRQRDQHRKAVAIVPGGIEPAVGMRVHDNKLIVSPPPHDANGVVSTKPLAHLGGQLDLDAQVAIFPRRSRPLHHRREETAIVAAKIEAGHTAVAE